MNPRGRVCVSGAADRLGNGSCLSRSRFSNRGSPVAKVGNRVVLGLRQPQSGKLTNKRRIPVRKTGIATLSKDVHRPEACQAAADRPPFFTPPIVSVLRASGHPEFMSRRLGSERSLKLCSAWGLLSVDPRHPRSQLHRVKYRSTLRIHTDAAAVGWLPLHARSCTRSTCR